MDRCINVVECYEDYDVAFAIDNSATISESQGGINNWYLILDFVKMIINSFTIAQDRTRVAVVDFGTFSF